MFHGCDELGTKMKMTKQKIGTALLAAAAGMTFVSVSQAQSVDGLLDKLVDKGVLSVKEAQDLREESDKNFNTALSAKLGMPDWVSSLKMNGDIRVRYENFNSGNSAFVDRNRYRYRLRFGIVANLADSFEAGFRLTSGEASGSFGGDPISGNTTFQDNGSKKFVYLDQVYGKWTPLKGPDVTGSIIAGKMENPFVFSDMVFDGDYTPEGGAIQLAYRINDEHSLKLNAGAFALDENGGSGQDPYLLGAQARWDAAWSTKWSHTLGVAGLGIYEDGQLSNTAVPNVNRGNTHNSTGNTNVAAYSFHTVVADASVTYMLDSAPYYNGPFPIKVGGDYMVNTEAPGSADNYGYSVGITLGKSGKRRTWDLSYTWKYLGANAWWEELVDSDFGAYYQSPLFGSALGSGYGSGTNVKGHILRFAYSPSDSVTLSAKWFLTYLMDGVSPGSDSQMNRLQVDAQWKF